jgi:hypothetical protein
MECWPGVRLDVVKVATPEAFSVAVPSAAAPSLKVTVPVGVPDAEPVTVVVRVTALPARAGFALEATAIEMFSWMTSFKTDEVLGRLEESPV